MIQTTYNLAPLPQMALEDRFVEEDIQEIEAAHDRIDQEFAINHKRRTFDWETDFPEIDGF